MYTLNPSHRALCAVLLVVSAALASGILNQKTLAASPVEITPAIMDYKGKARDIIRETITILNRGEQKISLYPSVNNVALEEGPRVFEDPSKADFSSSLANWINISRGGIELNPQETRVLELEIRVNLTARPGLYHALISFGGSPGSHEAHEPTGSAPGVMVNLEVSEEIKEHLALRHFSAERNIVLAGDPSFAYELENLGNRVEHPSGSIFVYDNRGKELAAISAVREKLSLEPNARKSLTSLIWDGARGFGRYKAVLSLQYGTGQNGKVQDTTFFWMIPWRWLALILGIFISGLTIFLTWAHRRYETWHSARAYARVSSLVAAPRTEKVFPVASNAQARESESVVDLRGLRKSNELKP